MHHLERQLGPPESAALSGARTSHVLTITSKAGSCLTRINTRFSLNWPQDRVPLVDGHGLRLNTKSVWLEFICIYEDDNCLFFSLLRPRSLDNRRTLPMSFRPCDQDACLSCRSSHPSH